MKKKAKTANDHLADILDELGGKSQAEAVPEGWISMPEILINSTVPVKTMQSRMNKAVADGKMERRQFRIHHGRAYQLIWHYRKIA